MCSRPFAHASISSAGGRSLRPCNQAGAQMLPAMLVSAFGASTPLLTVAEVGLKSTRFFLSPLTSRR
jgi:hypothetical protein